jgi:phosphoglycolate phosphatase
MLGGGPRVLVAKALEALDFTPSEAELDALLERYSAEYRARPSERTAFFADAARALPRLRDRGLLLGVCTNKRTDIAEQVLGHLGVRELFGAVIGSDLASRPKPDAAHLTETLAALGADAAGCLYVGDTEIDALTAKSAGVRYAHVDWGHQIDAPVAVRIREFSELLLHLDD